MTRQFQGQVAYVTGAGTGIGAAIATALAARGARVALIGRSETPLRDVESRIAADGGSAISLTADVSDAAAVRSSIDRTLEQFGRLDLAVNNAGVAGAAEPISDVAEERWSEVIGTNLSGIFLCMKHQIRVMRQQDTGAIVNISSVFADRGFSGRSAYSTSKHGIRGLTRSAALENARYNIRINEVQPGVIAVPRQNSNADEVNKIAAQIPIGRPGKGDEVAAAVCFLLSEEASYITGAHLAVDGGFLS